MIAEFSFGSVRTPWVWCMWWCWLMVKDLGWLPKGCRFDLFIVLSMNFHYCALGCSRVAVSVHYKLLWINLLIYLASCRPLYVTVVYQGKYSHCMRIGVAVPLNSTVSRLREAVSRETKIPPDQVQFPQVFCTVPTCFFASTSGLGLKIFTVSLNTILILH